MQKLSDRTSINNKHSPTLNQKENVSVLLSGSNYIWTHSLGSVV